MIKIHVNNEKETMKLGQVIGNYIVPGMVICLQGDLGTGKTTLTKGIVKGFGINDSVTSPTFTIINQYEGKNNLYHIDTYRIESSEEMIDLGVEDYLPANDGVTVVEWPELIENLLPKDRIILSFFAKGDNQRDISIYIKGDNPDYEKFLQELNKHDSIGN
ncbi:MAG: hypothetical protein APF76_06050 [Desulfitibacter sp. BRH_c19]|nr:MAG: hypothetical protein APF76_06050 [Desulfitibacter sp. BRH_c19]